MHHGVSLNIIEWKLIDLLLLVLFKLFIFDVVRTLNES